MDDPVGIHDDEADGHWDLVSWPAEVELGASGDHYFQLPDNGFDLDFDEMNPSRRRPTTREALRSRYRR